MSKKSKETAFVCNSCGASTHKWMGKCPSCGQWNTLVEEVVHHVSPKNVHRARGTTHATSIVDVEHEHTKRYQVGIGELDRVLGGGLVPGAVMLLGGEPGIGKSTLLLTTAFQLAKAGLTILYVSGEESLSQIRMTAERLSALHSNLFLMAETDLGIAQKEVDRIKPQVLILDSVQTLFVPELDSAPGTVSQVREVTGQIVKIAKTEKISTFLIGHITKEGAIAGPRLLEHMVDTVLYFESTRAGSYRILRAHKNRFGSTNEIGVFEMRGNGLAEVSNPSAFFLAERPVGKPGSAVAVTIEGTRPLLVEVQALCVSTLFGNPRRTTLGVDSTRTALLAAVLERRAGLNLAGQDLFVNVAGGVSLIETAADLPVCLAIASSLTNKPVNPHIACFGEVGLSGEIRGVSKTDARLAEAKHMGFHTVVLPKTGLEQIKIPSGLKVIPVTSIDDAIEHSLA